MRLRQRSSVGTSARQVGSLRNVLLFFLGGGGLERSSEEESAHSLNSFLGNLLWWNMFDLDAVCPAAVFLGPLSCTRSPNRPISFCPPTPLSVLLKCTIGRSLSGAPFLLGLAARLCFILLSERKAKDQGAVRALPSKASNEKLIGSRASYFAARWSKNNN